MVAPKHRVRTFCVWFVVVGEILAWTTPISGGDSKPDAGGQPTADSPWFTGPEFIEADPAGDREMDAASKEAAFNEIKQIQQQLGGSVLQGSNLINESSQPLANFDDHVRKQLGLPPQTSATLRKREEKSAFGFGLLASKRPESEVVRTLREQVTKLDSIANDIESLRAYEHADSLRETAKQLRLIARQLDAE